MNLRSAATFPCNADKSPISQRGFKDAMRGVEWRKAPLVGFPTGAVNGIDVLDIDGDAGRDWYDANFDAIPATRAHSTRRGMHLLFRHAPGLRCTESKIAEGVDVRAEGGYVIWWPREGLPVEDAPISEWPGWLLEEARAAHRSNVYPSTSIFSLRPVHGDVASLRDGLFKLDAVEWRGQYLPWLTLMMACKAAGISKEDWIAWSVSDECYADDADVIARKWDSVPARHSGALHAALSQRGIKYRAGKDRSAGVHISAVRPGNLQSRSNGLITWLRGNATADGLFSAAYLLAELGLREAVATKLIDGNLPTLRRALGEAEFNRQIANAFAHIEGKNELAARKQPRKELPRAEAGRQGEGGD